MTADQQITTDYKLYKVWQMQHDITWRNMLAYLSLPKCCIVACKQTKDKHIFREWALKLLSPEAF